MSYAERRPAALRDRTRDALRQARIGPSATMLAQLVTRIQSTLESYLRDSENQDTSRQAHDALRRLLGLLEQRDPPVGRIRERVRTLPQLAAQALERRAARLWPMLGGTDFSPEAFAEWVASADSEELIPRLQTLVVEGGVPVEGRSDVSTATELSAIVGSPAFSVQPLGNPPDSPGSPFRGAASHHAQAPVAVCARALRGRANHAIARPHSHHVPVAPSRSVLSDMPARLKAGP